MRLAGFVFVFAFAFVLACGPDSGPDCRAGDCRCEGSVCECVGTEPCDLRCGVERPCDFTCSTSGGCFFFPGAGANVVCQGTGDCRIGGFGTDITVACTTTGRCDISCDGCDVSCNPSACATRCTLTGECTYECPSFEQCDSTSAVCGDATCPVDAF